jgi:hypothetical protein
MVAKHKVVGYIKRFVHTCLVSGKKGAKCVRNPCEWGRSILQIAHHEASPINKYTREVPWYY